MTLRCLALIAASLSLLSGAAVARDQIQIAGSSTVLPYATIVAESFGENRGFQTPVVEGGGSGAGRKKLCEGQGGTTIDIANSSSPIKPSDIELCRKNGVTALMEVRIGYDGIVFASRRDGPEFALTPEVIWRALAAQVPQDGVLAANRATRWNEIDPGLPDLPITVFIPGTKHGSREVFDQKVLETGCATAGAEALFAAAATGSEEEKAKAATKACLTLRADGRSVDIDGDYAETLARVAANPDAIGVFGLSFYENNADRLRVATVGGIAPSVETIATGAYPVSRPLYFYVKPAHFDLVPGLRDYVLYFLSDEIAGPGGLLAGYGLVPDPELAATRAAVEAGTVLDMGGETVSGGDAPAATQPATEPVAQEQSAPANASRPATLVALLALALFGGGAFIAGRQRAIGLRAKGTAPFHSVPVYHGALVLLTALLPGLLGLLAWGGAGAGGSAALAAAATLLPAAAGGAYGYGRIGPDLRARTAVERVVMAALIGCSLIAVLTTAGIFASLVVEAGHFFRLYPAADFFFSTTWNPQFRGGSSLGIWPLIWGTFYVSLIALLVAVPVGLMSAIYLAEYASRRTRAWVKPAIEILAGIPTIVYGLFALITVGPLLRDWFAQPLGIGSSSSSVMTAGLVMGIMVIPFVSSLSDDIINAVPQALRDGSLGLGATPSETVRQVVLPAALPGIVGAILLAASRAIGETMIVVMGAGAAARLSLNPFEAMTTVTVKIVSQLTGDTEFASPETLVAFALGLTLFLVALALNVLALVIVRKYREQYE